MARVKYLGKKNPYGPLQLKWMIGEVKFKDGVSEAVEIEIATAICAESPVLFELVPEKKVTKRPARVQKKALIQTKE